MKRILGLLSLSLFACGPSVTTLVAERRWDESVCAVSNEREAQLAIPTIVEASRARFVVHEITRSELGAIDDATLGDFFTRYVVYAIDTRVDPTSTTTQTITGSIEGVRTMRTTDDFAAFTAEKIPEGHSEKQSVLTDAAASKAFFAVLSVGLSLLVDDRPMTKVVDVWVPPSSTEIEASAPRATKLAVAFALAHATAPHYIVPRSDPASVEIVVGVKNDASCSATATYHARVDTLKLDDWKNVRDTKWVSLHTSGEHVVTIER